MVQRSIATGSSNILSGKQSIEFSEENAEVIRKMIPNFGSTEEDVVLNALTLLYGIFTSMPDARNMTLHGPSGKSVRINMPK